VFKSKPFILLDNDVDFNTNLKEETLNMAAYLLASGIKPEKSNLFVQSYVNLLPL
jgi:tryptophanyl-tRNA synthetase